HPTCPPNVPAVVALNRRLKLVDWPAVSERSPRFETSEKPAGMADELSPVSDRVLLPTFVTVNIRVIAVPTVVVPTLAVPVSASSLPDIRTLISGVVRVVVATVAGGSEPRRVYCPTLP